MLIKFLNTNRLTLFIAIAALLVSLLESVTYYGFFAKFTFLPSWLVYLLSLIILLSIRHHLSNFPDIKRLLFVTLIVSSITLIIVTTIEALTYPNFIFSTIHLNLHTFPYFVLLLLSYYIIYTTKPETKLIELFSQLLLVTGISLYLYLNVPKVISGIYSGLTEIINYPAATYDEKMYKRYGDFYYAMKNVVDLTPENAVVAIPPQENPWLTEGNGAMVNYFLYPRKVVHIDQNEVDIKPTHFLIAKGSWNVEDKNKYGWPKEEVNAHRVWEFHNDSTYTQYERDYNPTTDTWNWGLIEVNP